jgi:hypothetical protein
LTSRRTRSAIAALALIMRRLLAVQTPQQRQEIRLRLEQDMDRQQAAAEAVQDPTAHMRAEYQAALLRWAAEKLLPDGFGAP